MSKKNTRAFFNMQGIKILIPDPFIVSSIFCRIAKKIHQLEVVIKSFPPPSSFFYNLHLFSILDINNYQLLISGTKKHRFKISNEEFSSNHIKYVSFFCHSEGEGARDWYVCTPPPILKARNVQCQFIRDVMWNARTPVKLYLISRLYRTRLIYLYSF